MLCSKLYANSFGWFDYVQALGYDIHADDYHE